jgi:hypothetical protein
VPIIKVFQALDFLPHTQFLSRIIRSAEGGSPATLKFLAEQVEDLSCTNETRRAYNDDCLMKLPNGQGAVVDIQKLRDYSAFRGFPTVDDLLHKKEWHAMKSIPLLAPVALTADLPDRKLTRGQIGTVVEHLEQDGEQALLIEFSDEDGETYAMVAVPPDQLMVLHRRTEAA